MDVGPRIIRYAEVGGENILKEYSDQMGTNGGEKYRSYGGHRLWRAPEDPVLTMQPENDPVEHASEGRWEVFRSRTDRFGIQKEIAVAVDTEREAFQIRHRIYNRGNEAARLAPWAITVMREGGECLAPMPPNEPHSDKTLLPVRQLALWSYTNLGDPRFTVGPRVLRLRHSKDGDNQKVGMPVPQGYAAYACNDLVFLKRFPYEQGKEYPDLGCNFETFTRHDMLEIESLGPLQSLAHGEFVEHVETWYLIKDVNVPRDSSEAADWLTSIAECRPLLR
jgi:hypothetical protein